LFTSLIYFPFLIAVAIVYWLLPRRALRNVLLILASLAFIWRFDEKAVYVTLALTLYTYLAGRWISHALPSKAAHRIGVIGLVLALVGCKYLGLLAGTLNSLTVFLGALPQFHIEHLFLPLGISYIVFKYISYLTDIQWGLNKGGSLVELLCFGSLFTIFVAGPIERFERLQPQLRAPAERFRLTWLQEAFTRIVFGLFKKLVLADWLGYFTSPVWSNPDGYGWGLRALALLGYSLQIYFDFAGYSDIAIGSSRLFGLRITENFNNPYLAPNISQFWRRWHISLSDWIRDYLFFPLSQLSGKRFWLMFCVPVIAMSLCGLWHGPAWHFMGWGAWHGLGIAVYQYWNQHKRKHRELARALNKPAYGYLAVAVNFLFVTIGWWWFR